MTENAKDEIVRKVFEHQSEIPLRNNRLHRRYSMEQIANFPDDVLSRYYFIVLEKLKQSAKLKKELQEKVFSEPDVDDQEIFYEIDTQSGLETQNSRSERKNYGNHDGFLGSEGPNPLSRILKKY